MPSGYGRELSAAMPVDALGLKEGNIVVNDALSTFYLWLYGVRHMVKDHSDGERKEGKCFI